MNAKTYTTKKQQGVSNDLRNQYRQTQSVFCRTRKVVRRLTKSEFRKMIRETRELFHREHLTQKDCVFIVYGISV